MEKKNRKNLIIAISIVAILLSAALAAVSMYIRERETNRVLDMELKRNEMELAVRKFAADSRLEQELHEKENYEKEISLRETLRDSMLEKDSKDLLTLVNPWNSIPDDWEEKTVKIGRRGKDEPMYLDQRAAGALERMLFDCEAAGCRPVVISAYRTGQYQQELFENKVMREMQNGVSADYAPISAAQSVAVPGTSEHELGFAVDIIDDNYQDLDYWQQWTDTQQWLMSNCINYGFILRYPDGTTDKTGIIFEPWHYRYVGKTLAKEYAESSAQTFEDFIAGR